MAETRPSPHSIEVRLAIRRSRYTLRARRLQKTSGQQSDRNGKSIFQHVEKPPIRAHEVTLKENPGKVSSQSAKTVSSKEPAFAALHHRDFRFFFIGTMLAMMADNIEHVVSYWLLFEKFHSPVLAGFADISHWTPFLLLSVYFGGVADRYDCRKVVQFAQILFMVVSATWAILFFTNTIQIWHAGLLLIVHGMAGVMWAPAEQLLIHDIVGTEHLQSAVRLNPTS